MNNLWGKLQFANGTSENVGTCNYVYISVNNKSIICEQYKSYRTKYSIIVKRYYLNYSYSNEDRKSSYSVVNLESAHIQTATVPGNPVHMYNIIIYGYTNIYRVSSKPTHHIRPMLLSIYMLFIPCKLFIHSCHIQYKII